MADALWQLGGWTMLHFLWVGAGLALIGGVVRAACNRAPAGVRYATSLATLGALAFAPAAIAAWLWQYGDLQPRALPGGSYLAHTMPQARRTLESSAVRDSELLVESPDAAPIDAVATLIDATPGQSPGLKVDPNGPVIDLKYQSPPTIPATPLLADAASTVDEVLRTSRVSEKRDHVTLAAALAVFEANVRHLPWLWLVGAPLMFAWLSTGLIGSRRLRRGCTPVCEGPAFDACQRLRQALRISRQVAVAVCDSVAQPMLVGIARPLIILPAAALNGWTAEELEMVLLHELAHVRRWDNLVNLVQRLVEAALFFHPAVWLVSRQVRRDREECCDATVVRRTNRPAEYAELLVAIASRLPRGQAPRLAVASAMASHPLAGRLRRILKLEEEPMKVSRRTLIAAAAAPLLVAYALLYAGAVGAQDPPLSKGAARPSTVASDDRAQGVSPREAADGEIESAVPLTQTTERPAAPPSELAGFPSGTTASENETASHATVEAAPTDQAAAEQLRELRVELQNIENAVKLATEYEGNGEAIELVSSAAVTLDPNVKTLRQQWRDLQQKLEVAIQESTADEVPTELADLIKQRRDVTAALKEARNVVRARIATEINHEGQSVLLKAVQYRAELTRLIKELEAGLAKTPLPPETAVESSAGENAARPTIGGAVLAKWQRIDFPQGFEATPENTRRIVEGLKSQVISARLRHVDGAAADSPFPADHYFEVKVPADSDLAPVWESRIEPGSTRSMMTCRLVEELSPGQLSVPLAAAVPAPALMKSMPMPAENAMKVLQRIDKETAEPAVAERLKQWRDQGHQAVVARFADGGRMIVEPSEAVVREWRNATGEGIENLELYYGTDGAVLRRRDGKNGELVSSPQPDASHSGTAASSTTTAPTPIASNPDQSDPLIVAPYPINDIDTIRLHDWLKVVANDPTSQVRWFEERGQFIFVATKDNQQRFKEFLKSVRRESVTSPSTKTALPSLEDQKIADRAYKLLGLELEPAKESELTVAKKLGYARGLRITASRQEGITDEFILVGLHVWPVTDLASLDAILSRKDLAELSPLKYYLAPDGKSRGREGWSGPLPEEIVTGRIDVDREALREMQRRAPADRRDAWNPSSWNDAPSVPPSAPAAASLFPKPSRTVSVAIPTEVAIPPGGKLVDSTSDGQAPLIESPANAASPRAARPSSLSPDTASATDAAKSQIRLEYRMMKGGPAPFFGGQQVDQAKIADIARKLGTPMDAITVTLAADKGVSFTDLASMMTMLRAIGLERIALEVRKTDAQDGRDKPAAAPTPAMNAPVWNSDSTPAPTPSQPLREQSILPATQWKTTRTTAYLNVKFPPSPRPLTPQEIEKRYMNVLAVAKSRRVIDAAVNRRGVRHLMADAKRRADLAERIADGLRATFPGDGEIMELRLEGGFGNPGYAEAWLDAVIDEFREVVGKAKDEADRPTIAVVQKAVATELTPMKPTPPRLPSHPALTAGYESPEASDPAPPSAAPSVPKVEIIQPAAAVSGDPSEKDFTATLRFNFDDNQNGPLSEADVDRRSTNLPKVIAAALKLPEVRELPTVRDGTVTKELLGKWLYATFPGDSDILKLRLSGNFSDGQAILDGVVKAYIAEVQGGFADEPASDGDATAAPSASATPAPSQPPLSTAYPAPVATQPTPQPAHAQTYNLAPGGPSITIPAPTAENPIPTATISAGPTFVYDGGNFSHWAGMWRSELKTEKRIEAINALAAFARAGMAKEAAAAILDVAGEYDFGVEGQTPESDLKTVIVHTLANRGGVSPDIWLPLLVERMRQDNRDAQQRWRALLVALLRNWDWQLAPPQSTGLLLELAEDKDAAVRAAAENALICREDIFTNAPITDRLRQMLGRENPPQELLKRLQFHHLDKFPEQVDLLFSENPKVLGMARNALSKSQPSDEDSSFEIANHLLAVLDDPQRSDDHVLAIQALAATKYSLRHEQYRYVAMRVIKRLQRIILEATEADADSDVLAAAVGALAQINHSQIELQEQVDAAEASSAVIYAYKAAGHEGMPTNRAAVFAKAIERAGDFASRQAILNPQTAAEK